MEYQYIDDITRADIAYRVKAQNLEELFTTASAVLMKQMVKTIEKVDAHIERPVNLHEGKIDMLLHSFLEEFLFYKDSENLLLLVRTIAISETKEGYTLKARLAGEEIDREKHHLITDIKAVTMHNFAVYREDNMWHCTVVLDV